MISGAMALAKDENVIEVTQFTGNSLYAVPMG